MIAPSADATSPEGSNPSVDPAELARLREELQREGERLEKLWEAYKAQEGDYQQALERVRTLTADLASRDAGASEQARRLAAKDQEIAAVKADLEATTARAKEVDALKKEIETLDVYKARIDELEAALSRDRERLAKLFVVYEETAAERDDLLKKLADKEK